MTCLTAELETEIRRLRIRIIGLGPAELDAAGAQTDEPGSASREGRTKSRREAITEALAEFSVIGSGGREVPDLGDQSRADQVVVLLEHGMRSAATGSDGDDRLARLIDAAIRLRRALA